MTKDKLIVIIGLIGLLTGLTCCSDDEENRRRTVVVRLSAYATPYTDIEPMSRETRAGVWPPEGFKPYGQLDNVSGAMKSNDGAAIGVYFTQGTNQPLARKFRPTIGNEWLIDDSVAAGTYQLYGFVPFSGIDTTTTQITYYNGSYANGAVLTLNGINSVSGQDVCLVVAAKHGSKTGDADPLPETTPKPGDFTCLFKASDPADPNYIFLLFDHLYAAMRFRFRISDDYAKLRTIKLRKLELEAYQDEDCLTPAKKVSTTVTLQANNTGASPIVGDVTFTPTSDDMEAALIANHESAPVKLKTDDWTDDLGFVPKTSSYYLLRTTFDVYDNDVTTAHPDGNLIRSRCVAENKINPRKLFILNSLERGYMYTIKLTVDPTYLYVLSDPDLDNPTVKIGN